MLFHFFKVAVRNLIRYKAQTIISLLGLAVGFTCLSLAVFWSHYELTYDAHQQNADRIYRVEYTNSRNIPTSISLGPLGSYLKSKYPEVDNVCIVRKKYSTVTINGIELPDEIVPEYVTSEAFSIFDFEWIDKLNDIEAWGDDKVVISEQLAERVCGKKSSPIGMKVLIGEKECEVAGVYKTWSKHSNFQFDVVGLLQVNGNQWRSLEGDTYIMLKPGADHELFLQKLQLDVVKDAYERSYVLNVLTPLKDIHYTDKDVERKVRLEDVNLFMGAAILLSVCALLNYLTLFISRMRNRGRDLALRTICGSSGWQMSGLLLTEYLLLLGGALIVSLLFIELSLNDFVELSLIQIDHSSIYMACGTLLLLVLVLAVLFSFIPILYFKKKTLYKHISSVPVRFGQNDFRLATVCLQLIISILFMFCSVVMIKQLYFLLNEDINIERKQIASINVQGLRSDRIMSVLKQIPAVVEMQALNESLFPPESPVYSQTDEWEGKAINSESVNYRVTYITNDIARFYGIKIKEGDESFDLGRFEVIVNEALVKALGMEDPIGKTLVENNFGFKVKKTIKGVAYDYHIQPPTKTVEPVCFQYVKTSNPFGVVFKYSGDFEDCRKAIIALFQRQEVQPEAVSITDGEQFYNQYLESEHNLLKLLGIITVASILIALFGIYALIMQLCEQHRKEIAIRKVNGAGVTDILLMFFKQYILQILVASFIAFPMGYVFMKRWLEHYNRQTEITVWVYLSIFLGVSVLVTLCIGWRVWRAANENPARVIKKE